MLNTSLFRRESDFADLDADGAVRHLSEAIRIPTVSQTDPGKTDQESFLRLRRYLRETYPHIAAAGKYEEVNGTVLIELPGANPALKPALFMAHQDVVPVVPGTEDDWLHGPFSGDVADGFIWGRGAIDIKCLLIARFESVEYLLAHGARFARTVYLASGPDEETYSTGMRALCAELQRRGVELEFVLDEGTGGVMDAAVYGAPGTIVGPIGLAEKGYADLRLTAQSRGGHSSNPFRGTSLGALAKAIAAIVDDPMPPHLNDLIIKSLSLLRPRIVDPDMRAWAKDPLSHQREIADWFLAREELYWQVRTTAAPTMISGGAPAGNVMPQRMEAMINFRLTPPDTTEALLKHCRRAVGDGVEMEYAQSIGPSRLSEADSYGFLAYRAALERYYKDVIFIPALNRGATDARHLEPVCRCVMRYNPFLEEGEIVREGMHGTNERISVRAYLQGIRVLIDMISSTCIHPNLSMEREP